MNHQNIEITEKVKLLEEACERKDYEKASQISKELTELWLKKGERNDAPHTLKGRVS